MNRNSSTPVACKRKPPPPSARPALGRRGGRGESGGPAAGIAGIAGIVKKPGSAIDGRRGPSELSARGPAGATGVVGEPHHRPFAPDSRYPAEVAPPITFRPVEADDQELLYRVYASTRSEELAPGPWTQAQKEAFLRMQFRPQTLDYQANYPDAERRLILVDGAPAGRLYVDRREDEGPIVAIAPLPAHRGAGARGPILHRPLPQAPPASHPL